MDAPLRSPRTWLLALALSGAVLLWALQGQQERLRGWLRRPVEPVQPTVVLIVLDTFRADWPSVCGGPVPTPTLEELASRDRGHFSCAAVTPGAWTLPSHASYFTGETVLEHGAHSFAGRGAAFWPPALPLDQRHPTLAEEHAARGYQTVVVSGNPLLGPATGLDRGFERSHVPVGFSSEGEDWIAALDATLAELDPERPLFLVLNLADAHSPWEAIPPGQEWTEARPADPMRWEQFWPQRDDVEALEGYAERYRWGMHRADRTLGLALEHLQASGWYAPGRDRLALTTDHGEVFNEEGFLGHGGSLLQSNVGSLLYVEGVDIHGLPSPVSSLEVHPLLLHGVLGGLAVESVAMPSEALKRASEGQVGYQSWLGHWEEGARWIWRDGALTLNGAPTEEAGPLGPLIRSFEGYSPDLEQSDPALEAMLEAAGYLE